MTTVSTYLGSTVGYPTESITISQSVTATSGDVVQLLNVKKGMVIHNLSLSYEGTASSTVTVGDGGDADRFITSTSTASSGITGLNAPTTHTTGVIVTGAGFEYAADDTIDLVIGGANVSTKVYTLTVTFSRTY